MPKLILSLDEASKTVAEKHRVNPEDVTITSGVESLREALEECYRNQSRLTAIRVLKDAIDIDIKMAKDVIDNMWERKNRGF
jgi:pyruvate formate-lyase activating enzyme-like uncharacterized protein